MFLTKHKYMGELSLLLQAFLLACVLWYIVVGRSQVESDIPLKVEYINLPENLVITKGMQDTVHVRVRVSAERLRNIQHKDFMYPINLKDISEGVNVFPVKLGKEYTDFNGMEILGVSPTYLVLETDILEEKTVPLEIAFSEKENNDLYIRDLRLDPAEVTLRGPSEILETIKSIKIDFDINQYEAAGTYSKNLPLSIPDLVEVDKPVTTVYFETWIDMTEIRLSRLVQIDKERFTTEPRTVNIDLEIPQSKMDDFNIDPAYMAQVRAIVRHSEDLQAGQNVPVHIVLPKGAKLLGVTPEYVNIADKDTSNPQLSADTAKNWKARFWTIFCRIIQLTRNKNRIDYETFFRNRRYSRLCK